MFERDTRSGRFGPTICRRSRADGRAVMAFAPRRRARRLWDYFRAERRTLRQGFAALLLGALTSFVAGITLASITDTLKELPGLLILIPAILGMRGTVFGAWGPGWARAPMRGSSR